MALDCLYAEFETLRDLSCAVTLRDHSQNFDLTWSERLERATQREGVGDRNGKASEVAFDQQIFGAGAQTGHGPLAVGHAGHNDQWSRGANFSQQCKRRLSVELRQRVIGQDDVWLKIPERGRESVFRVDTLADNGDTRSTQLVPDEFCIGFVVFEHEDSDG